MTYNPGVTPGGSIRGKARRSDDRRRALLALALVLSLLLHVPLVRLLVGIHRGERARALPVEVEVISRPKTPAGALAAGSSTSAGAAQGIPATDAPVETTRAPPSRPKMDLWRKSSPPDLRVRWSDLSRLSLDGLGPGRAAEAAARPKRSKASGGRKLSKNERAADRYLADLAAALLRAWDAERALKERGAPSWLENAAIYWKVWRERAESYGRTGRIAIPEATDQRLATIDGLPDRPGRDLARDAEAGRWMRETSAAFSRAAVRVTHRRNGTIASVKLVSPSGDPRLDTDAVRDLREAAGRLPRPPRAVLRGRSGLVSFWELELETSVTPPTPALAVQWDELSGSRDLRVPLDRRLHKKIRLVSWE